MKPKTIRRDADLHDTLGSAVKRMWERSEETLEPQYCVQHGSRVAVTTESTQRIGRVMCSTRKTGVVYDETIIPNQARSPTISCQ